MAHRPGPVALVALALVLAGCNGFVGGERTPAETVTPAPVPTDAPTSTPVPQLAPGLTGQGVTDVFALGEAHAAVLSDTSFAVHDEDVVRFTNGTPYRRAVTDAQLAANRTRYSGVEHYSGVVYFSDAATSGAVWSNSERVLIREKRNGTPSYRAPRGPDVERSSPSEVLGDLTNSEEVYSVFSGLETSVVGETTRNGTTLYEVAATGMTNRTTFGDAGVTRPRNVSFRALITSEGLVREYRLDYTATLTGDPLSVGAGETVTVHRTVRYSGLGSTTVERPPWYDAAIENATTATTATPTTA